MSVFVNGMEMPKECRDCPMETYYMHCGETRCRATNKILAKNYGVIQFDGRADFCPLTEVPEPHGDLIDRDAFKADYGMADECRNCKSDPRSCEFDRNYTKLDFCGWLDDAPTVIPREDGENHDT